MGTTGRMGKVGRDGFRQVEISRVVGMGRVGLLVGWLLNNPANMLVYLSDGSAQTILCTATL